MVIADDQKKKKITRSDFHLDNRLKKQSRGEIASLTGSEEVSFHCISPVKATGERCPSKD